MPTLTVAVHRVSEIREYGTVQSEFPAGASQGRNVFAGAVASRRRWELSWEIATPTVVSAISSVYTSTLGGADVFQWTPPGGSEIDCRFVGDLSRIRETNRLSRFSVVIEAA